MNLLAPTPTLCLFIPSHTIPTRAALMPHIIPKTHTPTRLNSPALLKIFDEILVNASDNRLRATRRIEVDVDESSGRITV